MAGVKHLVALALSGSLGLLLLFLACALPQFNNWIPFTVVVFHLASPLPSLLARRHGDSSPGSSPGKEIAWFLTTGIVVSAFALPIVLARAQVAVAPNPEQSSTTASPDYPMTSTDLSNITMNNNASPKIVATVSSPQLTTSNPPSSTTDPSPTTLTKAVSGKMATEPTDQLTTVIDVKACGLVLAANSIIFLTIFAFFVAFDSDDIEYSSSYSSW